jgi:hypothetical protein
MVSVENLPHSHDDIALPSPFGVTGVSGF